MDSTDQLIIATVQRIGGGVTPAELAYQTGETVDVVLMHLHQAITEGTIAVHAVTTTQSADRANGLPHGSRRLPSGKARITPRDPKPQPVAAPEPALTPAPEPASSCPPARPSRERYHDPLIELVELPGHRVQIVCDACDYRSKPQTTQQRAHTLKRQHMQGIRHRANRFAQSAAAAGEVVTT